MATDADSSALSGGLLVVLGIVVALGLLLFFFQYKGKTGPDVSIELPGVSAPSAPSAPSQ